MMIAQVPATATPRAALRWSHLYRNRTGELIEVVTEWWAENQPTPYPIVLEPDPDRPGYRRSQKLVKLSSGESFYPVEDLRN